MKKIFIFIVIFLLGINLTAYAELTQKKIIQSVSAYNLNKLLIRKHKRWK